MTKEHRVKPGDCITSIAHANGFTPSTLWSHAENAELRELREEMNALSPGDVVVIPDLTVKEIPAATEERHTFRKKETPSVLRLCLTRFVTPEEVQGASTPQGEDLDAVIDEGLATDNTEEEPRSECPYILNIDGKSRTGTTDGGGKLEEPIPSNARKAKLMLDPGTPEETVYEFSFGTTQPAATISGAKTRLSNLGFYHGSCDEEDDELFAFALSQFQAVQDLEANGLLDEATQTKLKEACGN